MHPFPATLYLQPVPDPLCRSLRVFPDSMSDSHIVNGTVWTKESYVHVRWGWITFLVVQIVFGVIFIVLTGLQRILRRGHDSGSDDDETGHLTLKSSTFGMLYALGEEGRRITGGVGTLEDMESRATGLMGKMEGPELVITREVEV